MTCCDGHLLEDHMDFLDELAETESRIAMDLSGQVAVVTGAGNGLGRSYARLLASMGASVVVNDIGLAHGPLVKAGATGDGEGQQHAVADRTVAEIQAAGGTAVAEYSSVATPEGGAAVIDKALTEFGRLDILVSNAGYVAGELFAKLDWQTLDAMLDVHLKGTFYVTQPAFNHMRRAGYGRIVLTSSAIGTWGNLGVSAYGAAKGGVLGLLSVLKLEAERFEDVKINCVAPVADTRRSPEDAALPEYASVTMEELAPELVAGVVAYLSSPACAVHGDVWSVGGGSVARMATVRAAGYFKHPLTEGPLAPEDVAEHLEEIRDLSDVAAPFRWQDEWELVRSQLRPQGETVES